MKNGMQTVAHIPPGRCIFDIMTSYNLTHFFLCSGPNREKYTKKGMAACIKVLHRALKWTLYGKTRNS